MNAHTPAGSGLDRGVLSVAAVVVLGVAFLPALLLPRRRPEAVEDGLPAEPVLAHA